MNKKKIKMGIGLFIIAIVFGYPFLKIQWAKTQVHKFCSEINPGDPVNNLKAKAENFSLKFRTMVPYKKGEKTYPSKIIVWEGWAFSRYFCDIEHDQKLVIKSSVTHLD
jgi:hypothetical protein